MSSTQDAARHLLRTVTPLLSPAPANDEQLLRLLDVIQKEVEQERRAAQQRIENPPPSGTVAAVPQAAAYFPRTTARRTGRIAGPGPGRPKKVRVASPVILEDTQDLFEQEERRQRLLAPSPDWNTVEREERVRNGE